MRWLLTHLDFEDDINIVFSLNISIEIVHG